MRLYIEIPDVVICVCMCKHMHATYVHICVPVHTYRQQQKHIIKLITMDYSCDVHRALAVFLLTL